MNKYNELKNFIDNFVEKNIHHFVDKNDKNVKNALKNIDNDKKILIDQIKDILGKDIDTSNSAFRRKLPQKKRVIHKSFY